jgi:signal transduction histidine kinase
VRRRLTYPRGWRTLPSHTIRLRLTVLFGALFLLSGAALLTVTYLLVDHEFTANGASFFISSGSVGNGVILGRSSSSSNGGLSISVHRTIPTGGTIKGQGSLAAGDALPAPTPAQLEAGAQAQSNAALHQLLVDSGIALAIMALISIWLGWLVAGRALQPLRTITNAAKGISATNLHRRLALKGPDDELKQLGNTFDELLSRLESSFDAQRQFVANASHELRTPLTLERTLVEVALADPHPSIASLRRTCEQVLAASEHHERLLEALLTLSRSQRGLDSHERIDLATTTAEALRTLGHDGLTVTTRLDPAWISGDRRLVERLVANLLTNAVRHNLPAGSIDLRTETTPAGRAVLAVTNTGPPIPAGELERLFQPFQRLGDERTDSSDGVGLGLSIVQAIAVAHDAEITTRTPHGGGLELEVSFPAATLHDPGEPSAAG